MLKKLLLGLTIVPGLCIAASCPQIKPIQVDKALIQKLTQLVPDSSNAHEAELLLGPACACFPLSSMPSETWMCQWKGNLSSNRLENTLNITFEAGMIAEIIGISKQGDYLTEMPRETK